MEEDAGGGGLRRPPGLPLECLVHLAPQEPERCPVLVLIHGAGGDERSLLPLARSLPQGFNVVLPRAPRRMPRGGFMWYPVRFTRQGPQADPAQVAAACAQLEALLRRLRAALGFAPPQVHLAGFSQGGALAAMLALRHPHALAGLALFGARWLPQLLAGSRREPLGPGPEAAPGLKARRQAAQDPLEQPAQPQPLQAPGCQERRRPRLEGLPVFVAHGTLDEVLPLHHAAQAIRVLLREHARPTLRLHAARHELSAAMAADFAQWLAPRAGPLSDGAGLGPSRAPAGGDGAASGR